MSYTWKNTGDARVLVSSVYHKAGTNLDVVDPFKANPIKHRRKDLMISLNTDDKDYTVAHTTRNLLSLENLERPGGTFITETASNEAGCTQTAYVFHPNITNSCSTAACDALARVRSAGMNVKQSALMSTNEFLQRRGMTYQQQTSSVVAAGSNARVGGENLFRLAQNCREYYTVAEDANLTFCVLWIDGSMCTVNLPPGSNYDVGKVNSLLRSKLIEQGFYFIHRVNGSYYVPLRLQFNLDTRYVVLVSDEITEETYGLTQYMTSIGATWGTTEGEPTVGYAKFYMYSNLTSLLGLPYSESTLIFPSEDAEGGTQKLGGVVSNPPIGDVATIITKKNGNRPFATHGAVSNAARIDRLKYNAIQTAAGSYYPDSAMANALSYAHSLTYAESSKEKTAVFQYTPSVDDSGDYKCCRKDSVILKR